MEDDGQTWTVSLCFLLCWLEGGVYREMVLSADISATISQTVTTTSTDFNQDVSVREDSETSAMSTRISSGRYPRFLARIEETGVFRPRPLRRALRRTRASCWTRWRNRLRTLGNTAHSQKMPLERNRCLENCSKLSLCYQQQDPCKPCTVVSSAACRFASSLKGPRFEHTCDATDVGVSEPRSRRTTRRS